MVEALEDAVRTDEGDLERLLRERSRTPELFERNVPLELQPARDRAPVHHRRACAGEIGHVEAGERRARGCAALVLGEPLGAGVVAGNREAEAVLKIEPSNLAVGHDIEADRFLQSQILADALELYPGEIGPGHRALLEVGARRLPCPRPKQAPHDVGADATELSHA